MACHLCAVQSTLGAVLAGWNVDCIGEEAFVSRCSFQVSCDGGLGQSEGRRDEENRWK